MKIQKLILNENLDNLEKILGNDSDVPANIELDVAMADAYVDSLEAKKNLEEVNKELEKRNDEVVGEIKEEDSYDLPDNIYNSQLILDEGLENFHLTEGAYGTKGNDEWQSLEDEDDKDYHLDYDMYDFLYALFRGLEGNANRNPKNPLGHTISTFRPNARDDNEKNQGAEVGEAQIGVILGNPFIITLSATKPEYFDDARAICDLYKISYQGPELRKSKASHWKYSMLVKVPMAAENYPMLLEDYLESIGLTIEDAMTPEFAKTYRNKLKKLNKDAEDYMSDIPLNKILDKYITIAYRDDSIEVETLIPDLASELKAAGASKKKSDSFIKRFLDETSPIEDDEE